MKVYYNENDKSAATWLRELIKKGVISNGEIDESSIEDVLPADIRKFDRCHFFAGIGVWDYALTQAGWSDDQQVWTGSCPCQPFSTAGKREKFADERHLWPAWFHLIEVCRPKRVFGEQVSSKGGTAWLDLVHSDLEGIGYAVGSLDIPAASVGAPHRRQRLYFVADSEIKGRGASGNLANADCERPQWGLSRRSDTKREIEHGHPRRNGPTNGFWADAEWIYCRDGKYRPVGTVKSGSFTLADELAGDLGLVRHPGGEVYKISPLIKNGEARAMRLRGYGNAINAEQAIAFIESYLEIVNR